MYQGVKNFIAHYRKPFDREASAIKKAKERMKERGESFTSKKGKELLEEEIALVKAEWDQKTKWGEEAHSSLQSAYIKKYPDTIKGEHKSQEQYNTNDILDINKVTPNTRYTEKVILDPHNNLIGYIDELYIDKNWNIHITEYKSSKNLNRYFTFMTPKGPMSEFYFSPISHVIDCNFNHATLQASLYMYILWYYNKRLKPGTITLKHIKLDEETGIILSIETHKAPYLLPEIKQLLKHNK